MHFNSFAILDLETTGLTFPKITEIAMVAFERRHCGSLGILPRVLHKFTVCVNPNSKIHPIASAISGLDNESLMNVSSFNKEIVESVRLYLQRLPEPVCFVAHNGLKFDYPLLKKEVENTGAAMIGGIYCIDSLLAFRQILTKPPVRDCPERDCPELSNIEEDLVCLSAMEKSEGEICDESLLNDNETTPETKARSLLMAPRKVKLTRMFNGNSTAKRKLDFTESQDVEPLSSQIDSLSQKTEFPIRSKPTSFKLDDIYEYFYGFQPIDNHMAENDVISLLECILKVNTAFFDYADKNAILFSSIK